MSNKEYNKIQAFDMLYTTNHICKLKLMLPYLDISLQRKMAIYIKYLEFQYTIQYFDAFDFTHTASTSFFGDFNSKAFIQDLLPYCTNEERKQMKQMEDVLSNIEHYQSMMENLSMIKELFPETTSSENTAPEMDFETISSMLQMFQSMNTDFE